MKKRKAVVWGCSKLLEFYLKQHANNTFEAVIDSYYAKDFFNGLPVIRPDAVPSYKEATIIIFAISSRAIQAIISQLQHHGRALGENVFLYSDL